MHFRMGKCGIGAVSILLIGLSIAHAQSLTEEQVLRLAEESPQVRALKSRPDIVRAETQARRLLKNPALIFTREEAGDTEEDFLLIQQELPLTGWRRLQRRAGVAAVSAAYDQSTYAVKQLRSDVRRTFYKLLLEHERESVLQEAVTKLQEVVRILREREREGEGSLFDRVRAERELVDIQAELAATQTLIAEERSHLASLLGLDTEPDSLHVIGDFEGATELAPLSDLTDRALSSRADNSAAHSRIEQFLLERRASKRRRLPEPTVSVGQKTVKTADEEDDGYVVSISVPLPLFNRGQAEEARAQAATTVAKAEHESLMQRIKAEVTAAYRTLIVRRRLADEYTAKLEEVSLLLAPAAQLAYEEGEMGILELLDAHRTTIASQLRVLELKAGAKEAEIELVRVVGAEVSP